MRKRIGKFTLSVGFAAFACMPLKVVQAQTLDSVNEQLVKGCDECTWYLASSFVYPRDCTAVRAARMIIRCVEACNAAEDDQGSTFVLAQVRQCKSYLDNPPNLGGALTPDIGPDDEILKNSLAPYKPLGKPTPSILWDPALRDLPVPRPGPGGD